MTVSARDRPSKPSVWRAFAQPSAWTMFFFGFASGMPFLLVAGTLAYWLTENGLELKNITLIASAGLTLGAAGADAAFQSAVARTTA